LIIDSGLAILKHGNGYRQEKTNNRKTNILEKTEDYETLRNKLVGKNTLINSHRKKYRDAFLEKICQHHTFKKANIEEIEMNTKHG